MAHLRPGFTSLVAAAIGIPSVAAAAAATAGGPPLRVAIDLSFGAGMNQKEHKSLAHQIIRACGAASNHPSPVALHLSAVALATEAEFECLPPAAHLDAWQRDGKIELLQPPACELWPADETIWLSPDAEDVLEAPLSSECVYVIGGLIDRTIRKGASLQRAKDSGARAYRLPIREHAPRSDIHPILSLPSMVQILADVYGGATWPQALQAGVPKRYLERRRREEERRAVVDE